MYIQEKRTIVSFFGTVLIFTLYISFVLNKYLAEGVSAADFHFWAAAILILIPVLIFFGILTHIVFSIINAVATREDEPMIVDERDRLIDLKATRNFYHVFMVGFLLSMGSLVVGLPPVAMFIILMFTMLVAGLTLDLSQFIYYRRGV